MPNFRFGAKFFKTIFLVVRYRVYLFIYLFIYLFFRNEFLIFLHQQLNQAVHAAEPQTNAVRLQFLKKL